MQLHQRLFVGGGVIGAATAYYLSERGVAVRLVERDDIACAASGKAGGFLALDWCDGSALAPLARLSFSLHAELAQKLQTDYGYRRLQTLAAVVSEKDSQQPPEGSVKLDWLSNGCRIVSMLGDEKTTAQVHPEQFTRALWQAAQSRGAQLIKGNVEGFDNNNGQVQSIRVDGQALRADVFVIAAGPWSGQLGMNLPPVYGLKGHSVILRPDVCIPAQALFLDYKTKHGKQIEPEVYPRPDGTVYLSGFSEPTLQPYPPQDVQPHAQASSALQTIAKTISRSFAGLAPERVQACYRPIVEDGLPLIGAIPELGNAFISTGHNCWGILNAPASGLVLAELIADGRAKSVDLEPFRPERLL